MQTADIQFDPDGTPRANKYNDIYFSTSNGLEETRYVFIEGNQLPTRWQIGVDFTIGETGFGSGLNFLATWQTWRATKVGRARLHYFSIESHPFTLVQLRQTMSHWPELNVLCGLLLEQYPHAVCGFHTMLFDEGSVSLTLAFADVATALTQCQIKADAWYLDGFAPSKNPAMWSQDILKGIASNTAVSGTLATFTAAGQVRRDLQAAGFTMSKCPGFGRKREMLVGTLATFESTEITSPWYALARPNPRPRAIAIIGAGIAGAQIAWQMAERGWQVVVYEQDEDYALRASGNQLGVVSPKFTSKPSLEERFSLTAFFYQLLQFDRMAKNGLHFNPCGMVQLAFNEREILRNQALFSPLSPRFPQDLVCILNREKVRQKSNVDSSYGGYFVPSAGAISPRHLVASLLDHPRINFRTKMQVRSIQACDESWQLSFGKEVHTTPLLVVANGAQLNHILPGMPITPVRGQTSQARLKAPLACVLGHQGYAIPDSSGGLIFGASFKRGEQNRALKDEDTLANQQQLQRWLPELAIENNHNCHAAIRATTSDRWPIVGPVPNEALYRQYYADLPLGKPAQTFPLAPYQANLFVIGGLGSRGLSTSGYCAQVLAEQITSDSLSSERSIREALHPARFLIRAIKQGL